jgi:hypothetical protein
MVTEVSLGMLSFRPHQSKSTVVLAVLLHELLVDRLLAEVARRVEGSRAHVGGVATLTRTHDPATSSSFASSPVNQKEDTLSSEPTPSHRIWTARWS